MKTERHVATVSANDDPEKRARIRVTCPSLVGDDETPIAGWVEPALDWGMFVIPDVGEVVEIEVTVGADTDESYRQSAIDQLNPRWRGTRFYDTRADQPRAIPHDDLVAINYAKRRGIQTPKGHTLVFDDTDGQESVSISWRNAAGKLQRIEVTDNLLTVSFDGAPPVHPAIAEHLQALYEALKVKLDLHDTHVHPTGVGPSGPGAPLIVAPAWDSNINSTKLVIPDG